MSGVALFVCDACGTVVEVETHDLPIETPTCPQHEEVPMLLAGWRDVPEMGGGPVEEYRDAGDGKGYVRKED